MGGYKMDGWLLILKKIIAGENLNLLMTYQSWSESDQAVICCSY